MISTDHASARPIRRAFTLIELLTVIAIIGILAAILIPTVGAVRQTAQQTACASNLRQAALAVLAYANDNRGLLPSGKNAAGQHTGTFRGIVDPTAAAEGKSVTVTVTTEVGNRQLSGLVANYLSAGRANLWRCPGNQAAWDATTNGTTYICNNQSGTSPSFFFGDTNAAAGSADATPKSINRPLMSGTVTRVSEPSRLWMLSDIDSTNYGGQVGMPLSTAANAIPPPHKGARNYAFFDGHVESRRLDDLPANP